MRLVHIVADGTPGGGTTFVLALVEAMVRDEGVELHVITQHDSHLMQRAAALGARVHCLDFFRSRLDPTVPLKLAGLLQDISPDVIHAHGGRAAFFLSFVRGLARSCARIYTVHGYHFLHKRPPARWLGALAERWTSGRVDTTVFVSENDRDLARRWRLLPRRASSRVVRNAIDLRQIPPARHVQMRKLAFLGRLTHQKDPLLFVDIARELAADGFTFLMLGSGDLEADVRARVAEYGLQDVFEMKTGLSREQALEAFRSAGACVFTSRWEGLPLVPLESMACGVPVVAAAVSSLAEVIQPGVTGFLVPDRQPQSFGAVLRRLCGDAQLHAAIASAARAHIEKEFSYERFVSDYRSLYAAASGSDACPPAINAARRT